ncbi:MAG: hypothetical protein WAM60_03585 [Candidatus Promineifilaceae bacterium]
MKWIKLSVLVILTAVFGIQLLAGQTADAQEQQSAESVGNGTLERLGAWPYGPSEAVTVDEGRSLAFVGSGGAVLTLDVSNPNAPVLISDSLRSSGLVKALDYDPATQRLYIAGHEAGLEIWDMADPAVPVRLSQTNIYYFGVSIPINDVALSGHFAILDGNYGYVHSVDVSDPTNPVDVSFNGIGGNPTLGVYADGNHAYACGPMFIRFVVQPNGQLSEAGYRDFYSLCGNFTVDNDQTAYVGVGSTMYILSLPSFVIQSAPNVGGIRDMAVRNGLGYVLNSTGLHIYDVTSSSNISLLGEVDTPGGAFDLEIAGNYAYVADSVLGLQIIDISKTGQPQIVGTYDDDMFGSTVNTLLDGNLAYLATGYSGLVIVDISDKVNPPIVGRFDTAGYANDVALEGSLAYIADDDDGLRILDVSNPGSPTEIGSYEGLEVWNVTVSGNYAYAVDFDSALHILDVSNPANPVLVGTLPQSGYIWEMALQGNYVYLANADNGVRIIDVSNPSQPVEVGSYVVPDTIDVQVQGSLAFVAAADYDGGFIILNVSNPSHPTQISRYNPSGFFWPFKVNVSGSYAYLTTPSASQKLYTFDISKPSNPVELDSFSTSGDVSEVTADGSFVYVSDGAAGLQIYHNTLSGPPPTPTVVPTPTNTPEPGGTLHVGDLDGSSTINGNRWNANVLITIHDSSENPLANATVNGSWSSGANGSGSCVTNGSGQCTISRDNIRGNRDSVIFTVNTVTHAANTYQAGDNHDPDGDSNGTNIEVFQEGAPEPTATPEPTSTPGPTATPSPTSTPTPTATPGSGTVIHVGDLDGSATIDGNRWSATVTITTLDAAGNPVANATVNGSWSNGANGSASCITDTLGQCSVTRNNIRGNRPSVTFTVTNVTAAGSTYNPGANQDPDGDSDGTVIVVLQP